MTDYIIIIWPIGQFRPYERNPRKNDHVVAQMEASIREFGFKIPILARSDGEVVDGHLRLKAAQNLGLKELPVILCDEWTPAQVKAFRLLVNKSVEWADWDADALKLELHELKDMKFDLALTGFELGEIDGLLNESWEPPSRASQRPPEAETVPAAVEGEDDVPEPQADPVTVLGDLWLLGEHRVLCGDSTSVDATSRLFGGEKPDLLFTDPPYGISIVQRNKVGGGGALKFGKVGGGNWADAKDYAEIQNDDSTDTAREFYGCAIACGVENLVIWGGNYFTDFLPPSPCWLIWDKQNTGNFADVEMAWTSFGKSAKLYPWLWNGLSREGDRKSELVSRVHPTQKPVGLFEKIFADFHFAICYDGFLGSGSTLIACEKARRRCFGMELSPQYVDVIIRRWQTFTGKQATLEADGRTFDELTAERLGRVAA